MFDDFKYQRKDVLVATDLASRGLDLPFVSHIINFDFPKSTSDYLHRAGRAGRAGRPGFVLSLIRETRDKLIVDELKRSNEEQTPLKIRGSAYSMKNKERIISDRKSMGLKVQIGGQKEKQAIDYKGGHLIT